MSEQTGYASANRAAVALLPKQVLDNSVIYPPRSVRASLYTIHADSIERMREIDRQWEAVKKAR
jgi:spermidine/putrescine-binding protein